MKEGQLIIVIFISILIKHANAFNECVLKLVFFLAHLSMKKVVIIAFIVFNEGVNLVIDAIETIRDLVFYFLVERNVTSASARDMLFDVGNKADAGDARRSFDVFGDRKKMCVGAESCFVEGAFKIIIKPYTEVEG